MRFLTGQHLNHYMSLAEEKGLRRVWLDDTLRFVVFPILDTSNRAREYPEYLPEVFNNTSVGGHVALTFYQTYMVLRELVCQYYLDY